MSGDTKVKTKSRKTSVGKKKKLDDGFDMSPQPEREEGEVSLKVLLCLAQRVELFQQSLLRIELGGNSNHRPRVWSMRNDPKAGRSNIGGNGKKTETNLIGRFKEDSPSFLLRSGPQNAQTSTQTFELEVNLKFRGCPSLEN